AGIGGLGNLFYAYYLRDKGIGMGARIPALLNPLREAQKGSGATGYRFEDTELNTNRFKDWFRFVQVDTAVLFWIANTLTMFLFMFGALVVLFPQGIVPRESQIIWDMALILDGIMGTSGRYLFLVIAIAAFFSSVLAGLDGGVRLWVDLLHSNFRFANRIAANKLYLGMALGLGSLGVAATWYFETHDVTVLDFFFLGAMLGGFAMAGYVPMLLYMNLKYLPPSARPGPINIVMVGIAGVTYMSFAIYTIWSKLVEVFG
ncbi:MAG: Nramp family divalent metal transporter, partial [Gammaproteobacteria bacterium]|nr:Nramp family divalent metal transporter [Gammaproteobacteria bacterium]